MLDEMSTTQKIWEPVATLDAQHRAAFTELSAAVYRGDTLEQERLFKVITEIVKQQEIAHRDARTYAVERVKGPDQSVVAAILSRVQEWKEKQQHA